MKIVSISICDDCRRITSGFCWKHSGTGFNGNYYGAVFCLCGECLEIRFNYCPKCGRKKTNL